MSQTFNKYGVPDSDGNLQSAIQPKLQYRFKLAFVNFAGQTDNFELSKNVTTFNLPTFEQDDVVIDAYVSRYYVVGKASFGTISVTLRNDQDNNVAKLIQAQQDLQHNAFTQSHAPAAGAVKFGLKAMWLDGRTGEGGEDGPDILEAWHFTGCWLNNINWNGGDYASNEVNTIELTIRPDNAFHIVDQTQLSNEESVSFTNSTAASSGDISLTVSDDNSAV